MKPSLIKPLSVRIAKKMLGNRSPAEVFWKKPNRCVSD